MPVHRSFGNGGSIDVETYDYNSLVGKYANLYSMGVSLPSEHRIEGVMFSSPNFRYRYLTLQFDRGIAPIPINEINAFLNNEIIYVNDNKEEYGIQLIPNQFAKGGKTANTMKLEDYEMFAINAHMGGFDKREYVIGETFDICPLAVELHVADLRATYTKQK